MFFLYKSVVFCSSFGAAVASKTSGELQLLLT